MKIAPAGGVTKGAYYDSTTSIRTVGELFSSATLHGQLGGADLDDPAMSFPARSFTSWRTWSKTG